MFISVIENAFENAFVFCVFMTLTLERHMCFQLFRESDTEGSNKRQGSQSGSDYADSDDTVKLIDSLEDRIRKQTILQYL